MTIYKSNFNVFWKDGVNVPDFYLIGDIELSFEEDNLHLNYVDFKTVQIVATEDLDISLIKFKDNNLTKYFYFSRVDKIGNQKRIYTFILDLYLTYTVPLLNKMDRKQTPFYLLRNPWLDKTTTMFNDPLYEDIKYTGSYDFRKFWFTNVGLTDVFYWEYKNSRIVYPQSSQGDVVNGVMYAVFNAGENGKYLYIPVLSKEKDLFYESTNSYNTKKYFKLVLKNPEIYNTYVSLQDINYWVYDKNNNLVDWNDFINSLNTFTTQYKLNIIFDYDLKNEGKSKTWVQNVNLTTSQIQSIIYHMSRRARPDTQISKEYTSNFTNFIDFTRKGTTKYFNEGDNFSIEFITPANVLNRFNINNSYKNITELKNSVEYSNKFLGIYFLPHVLFLEDKIQLKTISYTSPTTNQTTSKIFLSLDFQPEGNIILERELLNNTLSDNIIPDTNNPNLINWYHYKYLKCKYYNNDIDLSLYFKDNTFKTKGYFNFTGAGNYIDKVPQQSITNCLWSYPYQLPSGTDGYLQYVSSTYNSTNTSVNIAKQQYQLGMIGSIFGGIGSLATSFVNPLLGAGGLVGSVFGGVKNHLSYSNQMKTLKSQFADAKNTNGTQIANSMLLDAAWINYYLKDEEQYSGLEIFEGDASFYQQLNNIVYYYSYYSPRMKTIQEIKEFNQSSFLDNNTEWDNIFIQFEQSDLENKLIFELNDVEIEIKQTIFNSLTNGLRLWRKLPD